MRRDLKPCPWIRRFFNHDALAASAVDRSVIMDTYTTNATAWPYVLWYMQKYYDVGKIGWGLYPTSSGWGHALPNGTFQHAPASTEVAAAMGRRAIQTPHSRFHK